MPRRRVTGSTPNTRWSQRVTTRSNALDLEREVFKKRSARAMAASLKRSALRSRRRKGTPYQSAMSMLNFYINRAGRTLSPARRQTLQRAKHELRREFAAQLTGRTHGAISTFIAASLDAELLECRRFAMEEPPGQ